MKIYSHMINMIWVVFVGVGNDPREDRYFSIPKQVWKIFLFAFVSEVRILRWFGNIVQAQNYDPDGEFVAYWLPRLKPLPKEKRHSPGMLLYMKPVVALKFGNTKPITSEEKKKRRSNKGKWTTFFCFMYKRNSCIACSTFFIVLQLLFFLSINICSQRKSSLTKVRNPVDRLVVLLLLLLLKRHVLEIYEEEKNTNCITYFGEERENKKW